MFGPLLTPPAQKPRFIAHYEGNEEKVIPEIISLLESGLNGCLVSNAGTPLISDPGFRLVKGCLAAQIHLIPIPGPCAVTAALSVAGLSPDRYLFVGFLPKKTAKRERVFKGIDQLASQLGFTGVFYESPFRLNKLLNQLVSRWPLAHGVVAREMTKLHEEIGRGSLEELVDLFKDRTVKGELVVLVRFEEKKS
ncbi:rRNA small subunit methyltransferase 1 [Patescibacteria group bacterium]|nr:rRNA small subunit methyltransferase 1 [Patescibacteria group bacterium]